MWSRMKRIGSVIYKPKERRLAEKLTEGRIHIVTLQKLLIDEELKEKKVKLTLLQEEIDNKKELFELQKQEMLLKIETCKAKLESMRGTQKNNECDYQFESK